jgi:hypothetical protein
MCFQAFCEYISLREQPGGKVALGAIRKNRDNETAFVFRAACNL